MEKVEVSADRRAIVWGLAASWFFLFQMPFYWADVPVLYAVSKLGITLIAAVATASLITIGFVTLRVNATGSFVMATVAGLMVSSAIAAKVYFGQPITAGVVAQLKVAAGLYFFLASALLMTFRPSGHELLRSLVIPALVALAFALVLEVFKQPLYGFLQARSGEPSLIHFEGERGLRVAMHWLLPQLVVFLCWRMVLSKHPEGYPLLLPALAILAMIGFVQGQRQEFVGTVLVLALVGLRTVTGIANKLILVASAAFLLAVAVSVLPVFSPANLLESGGLRLLSGETVLSVLREDAMRWAYGVGALSRVGPLGSLQDIFGQNFWPSDLGWLGIIFEFGILGSIVFGLWYAFALSWSRMGAARLGDTLAGFVAAALGDLVLKMIITSPLIPSVPLYLGAVGTILAISRYITICPFLRTSHSA